HQRLVGRAWRLPDQPNRSENAGSRQWWRIGGAGRFDSRPAFEVGEQPSIEGNGRGVGIVVPERDLSGDGLFGSESGVDAQHSPDALPNQSSREHQYQRQRDFRDDQDTASAMRARG